MANGPGTHGSKTSPPSIRTAQRDAQALEMRLSGATFQQISDALGYRGKANAWQAIQRRLDRDIKPAVQELVQIELERLDRQYLQLDARRRLGDPAAHAASLKISERRARLQGLDDYERRMVAIAEQRVALEAAEADRLFAAISRTVERILPADLRQPFFDMLTSELISAGAQPPPDRAGGQIPSELLAAQLEDTADADTGP